MPLRGDRLRWARGQADLSQQELADRVHMSKSQIYRYETGHGDPSAEYLARIAKELNVSLDWLMGVTDEPRSVTTGVSPEILDLAMRLSRGPKDLLDLIKRLVRGEE